MNLTELGQTLSPPVGKSGVNHRLRRLMQILRDELPSTDDGDTPKPSADNPEPSP